MILSLDFKIKKEKVEIISEYSQAILKIRFQVIINKTPFYMDKKMFKTLIKDKDFLNSLKEICHEEVKLNEKEIKKALDKRVEKFHNSNHINVLNRGHGFSLNLVFENDNINNMTDIIEEFKYLTY